MAREEIPGAPAKRAQRTRGAGVGRKSFRPGKRQPEMRSVPPAAVRHRIVSGASKYNGRPCLHIDGRCLLQPNLVLLLNPEELCRTGGLSCVRVRRIQDVGPLAGGGIRGLEGSGTAPPEDDAVT